jgi:hypothetical protein
LASAQKCLNLYIEPVPQAEGEPSPAIHYPTPGLRLLTTIGTGPIRGIRQAATGAIYIVSGAAVYQIDSAQWTSTFIGDITAGTTTVSMADNGLEMVIVDGSATGWHITLATNAFGTISDPNFFGADRADYLDTYLLFNKSGTPQFYSSDSLALTFDPLFFANKESYSDLLRTLIVSRRTIWLIGDKTTEIWSNVGAPDFPFQSQSDVFIDHGVAAIRSVAGFDNGVFWLTSDRTGQGIVLQGAGYQTKRISTWAIENEIKGYSNYIDAIGFCYNDLGHTFYVLTFPTADKTWVYDITTGHWHEWAWTDPATGLQHRHRANCFWPIQGAPLFNGILAVGDWQNGNIYELAHDAFTDNGAPIQRVRSFPHMVQEGRRIYYSQFLADMEAGTSASGADQITLRWSDDRGFTYGNPVSQSLGAPGAYLTSLQWQRLGMARDRVFELSWFCNAQVSLQGAWINATVGDAPTAAPAGAEAG